MENTQVLLNIVWTMVGAFLVYFMQAGFAWWRQDLQERKTLETF